MSRWVGRGTSIVYRLKRFDERINPCGTPFMKGLMVDHVSLSIVCSIKRFKCQINKVNNTQSAVTCQKSRKLTSWESASLLLMR